MSPCSGDCCAIVVLKSGLGTKAGVFSVQQSTLRCTCLLKDVKEARRFASYYLLPAVVTACRFLVLRSTRASYLMCLHMQTGVSDACSCDRVDVFMLPGMQH